MIKNHVSTKKIKKVKKNENTVYLFIFICYLSINIELLIYKIEVKMAENKALGRTKSRYDILQNSKREILIIIQSCNGGAETPLFIYDGTEKALLYRSHESTVYFEDIAPKARDALKAVSELQIVEIEDDDVTREYKVPVRLVKDITALLD